MAKYQAKLPLTLTFIGLFLLLNVQPVAASEPIIPAANSPYDVIAAINQYRSENGLPTLVENSILMTTAQGQSDYQASIGYVTHDGPGGTRPKDRATAAGYGGGSVIFLSEIIYGGYYADVSAAMTWWKGSSLHNSVMLSSTYTEIGAGIATDGTTNYYTALLGNVSGYYPPPGSTDSGSSGSGSSSGSAGNPIYIPITMATPNEDGSIVHIIRTGQALWNVAAIYEVPLETLFTLNGMNEKSIVKPGDEILVKAAGDDSQSEIIGLPTPTLEPTQTPGRPFDENGVPLAPVPASTLVNALSLTEQAEGLSNPDDPVTLSSPVRWILIFAFGLVVVITLGSIFFQKQPERPSHDDPVL